MLVLLVDLGCNDGKTYLRNLLDFLYESSLLSKNLSFFASQSLKPHDLDLEDIVIVFEDDMDEEDNIPEVTFQDLYERFSSLQYDFPVDNLEFPEADILDLSITEEDFGELPDDPLWWAMVLNPEEFSDEHSIDVCDKILEDDWGLLKEFSDIEDEQEDYFTFGHYLDEVLTISETDEELELEISVDGIIDAAGEGPEAFKLCLIDKLKEEVEQK